MKIKLYVYHLDEDDPKKCSAKKMHRFNHATVEKNIRKLPKHAILLSPFSKKSLSNEDIKTAEENGIIAVDCSWKNADTCFSKLEHNCISRALPFVIAVNPINYGKTLKLTTLEAFSAALYILGYVDQAEEILTIYKWGPHFIELNKEPLEDYRRAKTSKELIKAMNQYILED